MADAAFVRLYIDADVTPALARLLREHGFDAISAHEVGNAKLADADQMTHAASQGRAILTYNSKDFARLLDQYWWEGREHQGVIVSQQMPIGELLRRTLRLLNSITPDQMQNTYRNLAEFA